MANEAIMIVEDEGLIALQMSEILENAGYRIIGPFCIGSHAIKAAESSIISLILMDITLLGNLDGIETARKIHERTLIPLIFITAHTSGKMQVRMAEIAHLGVIAKPFGDKELLRLVRNALNPDS